MRVEESIIIDRPPEEVFRFFSVRSNDPVWMASVVESEWMRPHPWVWVAVDGWS